MGQELEGLVWTKVMGDSRNWKQLESCNLRGRVCKIICSIYYLFSCYFKFHEVGISLHCSCKISLTVDSPQTFVDHYLKSFSKTFFSRESGNPGKYQIQISLKTWSLSE